MTDSAKDRPVADLSFREASVELEGIVRDLEGGTLELEESLARYARGVELLKSLRERLAKAEQQVQVLLDESDGATEVQDTAAAPASIDVVR